MNNATLYEDQCGSNESTIDEDDMIINNSNGVIPSGERLASFAVASKVSPKTIGLWVLVTNIILRDNSTLILLDSEGFYSENVGDSYDAKIFTATTMISSYLLYNSIKLIDQSAVDYLEILGIPYTHTQP